MDKKVRPVRVLQFGEGGFLRAFVDWMFDILNESGECNGSINVVQPIPCGMVEQLNEQEGVYSLLMRGLQEGGAVQQLRTITCINEGIDVYKEFKKYLEQAHNPDLRYVVSNTTEAGITYDPNDRADMTPPASFPAKVAVLLYERFRVFSGAADKGLLFLPCELIDQNGETLKRIVLRYAREWQLGETFIDWVTHCNTFCNTLVDRIVTGYNREEAEKAGMADDKLFDTSELFHLWVIEGGGHYEKELPFAKAGLHVIWTDDMSFYRTRKVRILNGTHTMTVLAAYLCGLNTVEDCLKDDIIRTMMERGIYEEIIPAVPLDKEQLTAYANDVFERFANPFIVHKLLSISLNSVSKWKARVLPTVCEYIEQFDRAPRILSFSLAALMVFYRGKREKEGFVGDRQGQPYPIADDQAVLDYFAAAWEAYGQGRLTAAAFVHKILAQEDFWGQNLNELTGMTEAVAAALTDILQNGMRAAVESLLR